jgi:hypothetical protein
MVLLGICVVALLVGALHLATERTPLPTGSSFSTQPEGAMALYAWTEAVGANPTRFREAPVDDPVTSLLILQPEATVDAKSHAAFDALAERGGTLVLAGDSFAWLLYARELGVAVDPISPTVGTTFYQQQRVPAPARYKLRAGQAEPLLTNSDGNVVALRAPYKQGHMIVIATPGPLTNAGLTDEQTARFVFREIVAPAVGHGIAFDELHHSFAPTAPGTATLNTLLFNTSAGRAVIYAALLTFVYLLLGGRRLGPALPARNPGETPRTMYEHVQMLANLYRRAGQFGVVRDAFSRHYSRLLARGNAGTSRSASVAQALERIQVARNESELVGAVAAADDAG